MRFYYPDLLLYTALLAGALFGFYIWALGRRRAAMDAFASSALIGKITVFYDRNMNLFRAACSIGAAALILVALARPQWGFQWKENAPKGIDILVALDVSKSMLAKDVLPSRLGFAKAEIADFAKTLKTDRIGLIAFAGDAFLQCPLTIHYNGFILTLNDVDVGVISKGGTSIPRAIDEAIRGYGGAKTSDRVLIIITDGENTEGDLEKAVERARTEKVRIFCIGIGTREGSYIPSAEEKEAGAFIKDESGRVVKSRLDEEALSRMAASTGGAYIHATQDEFGLRQIYDKYLTGLEKKEFKGNMVKVYKERFQIPLALAALLLAAGLISFRKAEEKKSEEKKL
jgi:Ca-activated chloride channel family protein